MKLRFSETDILYWAQRYSELADEGLENELTDKTLIDNVQQQEYIDRTLLKKIAYWKSPRSATRIERNSESEVREITGYAFKSQSERVRWGILSCLEGVGLPTASAILHLFHKQPYPIIDDPALWSIGVQKYNHSFAFWQQYVAFSRQLAKRNKVDMRTLDRALWQYSKEIQERT